MTLMEVVVAIALLTVLTAAAVMLVTRATTISADNRARIGASALGQRELDLAASVIGASVDGIEILADPQVAVNPNLTGVEESGDDEFPFLLDGQKYRVERSVERRAIGSGSPCQGGAGAARQMAAVVQVQVTWEGMSATTKPHVTSALFPPHAGTAAESLAEKAVIGVKVTGLYNPASPAQAGIKVQANAPGFRQEAVTDSRGCAVFVMNPPTAGFDVEVTLLGRGHEKYVNLAQEAQPTVTEHSVTPGSSRNPLFENYDQAASLVVHVEGAPDVDEVTITPLAGAAGDKIAAPLVNGVAEFELLHPSTYALQVGTSTTVSVTLEPGERLVETVVVS
jgi:type II secretory pathway pseudopilin PulG